MKHTRLFSILAGALLLYSSQTAAKQNSVTICHKGHTITIAESAAAAHLAHGDSEGECTEQQQADAEKEQSEYQYLYFPSVQVYYDESRALYFFQVEGVWQEAAELPAAITVNQEEMVSVTLDVDLPYIEHEQILERYSSSTAPLSESETPAEGNNENDTQEKVTICHKGKQTLTIAKTALQAHLNHGDTEGACQNQQQEKQGNSEQKTDKAKEKQGKGKGKNKD